MPRWPNCKNPKKSGPPPTVIDWKKVAEWYAEGLATTHVAARLGLTDETVYFRFGKDKPDKDCPSLTSFKAKHRARGDGALHSTQYQKAVKGNVELLKWLGRERLGQGEKNAEIDPADIRNAVVIEQEVQRRVAALIQQGATSQSTISLEQSVPHQDSRREEDPVSNELGAGGPI